MSVLDSLNWRHVRGQYDVRREVRSRLRDLLRQPPSADFTRLLVGIDDGNANYSAAEHKLGPKIITANPAVDARVHDLARRFARVRHGRDVPRLIEQADLSYLSIGVGSEASCIVNPRVCWVTNTRSVWAHLLIKHGDRTDRANEELSLYRQSDGESEMAYALWHHLHLGLDTAMTRLAEMGSIEAQKRGVKTGKLKYLWADAIANALYERRT